MGALAAAAAHVSTKEQEAQARLAAEMAARETRVALAKGAYEMLAENAERLWGQIHSQAANAERFTDIGMKDFIFQIGNGQLLIERSTSVLKPELFPHSGWDVVAFSKIKVNQHQPNYCWSASLWFVKMKGASDYRWHEAAYWSTTGGQFEPHTEDPGRDADFAASNVMHSVNLAFGPVAIDDENEDEFHDRWIWLLSKAAVGQLRQPSRMPFSWPPF